MKDDCDRKETGYKSWIIRHAGVLAILVSPFSIILTTIILEAWFEGTAFITTFIAAFFHVILSTGQIYAEEPPLLTGFPVFALYIALSVVGPVFYTLLIIALLRVLRRKERIIKITGIGIYFVSLVCLITYGRVFLDTRVRFTPFWSVGPVFIVPQ